MSTVSVFTVSESDGDTRMKYACIPGIKPPGVLHMDKAQRVPWLQWKQQWQDYCILQSIIERPNEFQAALFRTAVGPDPQNVITTFDLPVDSAEAKAKIVKPNESVQMSITTMLTMMDYYVEGQTNITYERYLLRKRTQQNGNQLNPISHN